MTESTLHGLAAKLGHDPCKGFVCVCPAFTPIWFDVIVPILCVLSCYTVYFFAHLLTSTTVTVSAALFGCHLYQLPPFYVTTLLSHAVCLAEAACSLFVSAENPFQLLCAVMANPIATLETTMGKIKVELFLDRVPITAHTLA